MDLGLSGKKAIITGATRGIGRAIANLLADEGVSLAICSRDQDSVTKAVKELSAKGVKVTGAAIDVADKESYKAWITSAGKELGGIDMFVPNVSAGGGTSMRQAGPKTSTSICWARRAASKRRCRFWKNRTAASIVVIGSVAAVEEFMCRRPTTPSRRP